MKLIPKNWQTFQHYGTRRPPWIKLHRALLDDRKFNCLPDASRALAPCLWLLASENADGCFDADPEELGFRLRQSAAWVAKALKPLIDNGFFLPASGMLAECLQDACLETERETEKEREKEAEKREKPRKRGGTSLLDASALVGLGVDSQHAADWLAVRKAKEMPLTATAWEQTVSEAAKAGISPAEAVRLSAANGWAGFRASWLAKQDEPKTGSASIRPINRQIAVEAENKRAGAEWLAQEAAREAQEKQRGIA